MRLGVDLGTTWTAAIQDDGGCEAVQLAHHTIAMPTVVAVVDDQIVAASGGGRAGG